MKKKILKRLASWLDIIFLLPGMILITAGAFQIYIPAGYILCGCCFIALAFFIGKKQASGR